MVRLKVLSTHLDKLHTSRGHTFLLTPLFYTTFGMASMIGDRMDTDIVAGIESGLRTILVLTGVTTREQVERFPYRPTWVRASIGDVEV